MANLEHLKTLLCGVKAWNAWRANNPHIIPDLRGLNYNSTKLRSIDLSKANLMGVSLTYADLYNANLSEANISNADLSFAKLKRTTINNTNLSNARLAGVSFIEAYISNSIFNGAELSSSNFEKATILKSAFLSSKLFYVNFTDANISQAQLINSHFSYANFLGANIHRTILGGTLFIDSDLSQVRGLESCDHRGASTVDHNTLIKSDNLPIEFLRGCGLPDDLIGFIPTLKGSPIQYYSAFISYSSKDQEFAKRLHSDLQNNGLRCWFAPEDLKIGEKIRHAIDGAIRFHDKLLLIISENSIDSDWVENEVETALEKEIQSKDNKTVLFPIRLDDSVMETTNPWAGTIKRTRHIGNFTNWKDHDSYQRAFERLLRDLKKS